MQEGDYTFQLTVTDSARQRSTAEVTLIVQPGKSVQAHLRCPSGLAQPGALAPFSIASSPRMAPLIWRPQCLVPLNQGLVHFLSKQAVKSSIKQNPGADPEGSTEVCASKTQIIAPEFHILQSLFWKLLRVLRSVFLLFCHYPARVLVWFEFIQKNCIVFPRKKCQPRTFQKLLLSHVYLGLRAKWWISPNCLGLMWFFNAFFFHSMFAFYIHSGLFCPCAGLTFHHGEIFYLSVAAWYIAFVDDPFWGKFTAVIHCRNQEHELEVWCVVVPFRPIIMWS